MNMKKNTSAREINNSNQLPVVPNEEVQPKPVAKPVQPEVKPILNKKELFQSMKDFEQPNCWIDLKQLSNDAYETWNILKDKPMVRFNYPINFGEKRGTIQTASINELGFVLRAGYEVKIPEDIYILFKNKLDAESGVGYDLNIENQSAEVKDALTR